MSRRPWGSPQQKRGRWYAVFTPHKGSGDRVWEPVHPNTRTRALERLAELQTELANGTYEDHRKVVRFDTLAGEWQATLAPTWATQTATTRTGHLDRYILPALGDLPARAIDGPTLQRFANDLAIAPRTVRLVVGLVRQILRWGHRHGRIRRLPDLTVTFPKLHNRKIEVFTPDEIRAVLDAALDYRTMLLWGVLTGMRQGEIMAAKWKHLDAEAGTYHVCESCRRDRTIGPTKTGEAGDVWVPAELLQALEAQRAQIAAWRLLRPAWRDCGLIFPSRRGGEPMYHTTLIRALNTACDMAGVRRRNFHALRHTCASLMIDQGETIVTVSRQLRHSNPSVTLKTYSHMMPERGPEAVARLASIIVGG